MSITESIARIAADYLEAKNQPLRDHPLGAFIRDQLPSEIETVVNQDGKTPAFVVRGAPMPGNWAAVPWVAITDPRLTDRIQKGVTVVVLFHEAMREVYLALGMGVQRTPEATRTTWLSAIQSQFPPPDGFAKGPLPERSLAASGTGAKYGPSLVYLKRYDTSALPSESDFSRDLISITKLLRRLGDSGKFRAADVPDDTGKVSVRVHGRDFEFSAADVERAFAVTEERHWLDLPGSEPVWHVVVGDQSKPLKAVFRNMPGVPTGFQFTKDEAARAFRRLGYDVVDTSPNEKEGATSELSLLGTWRNVEADAERVRAAISSKGAWASWWSFPIREEFRRQLERGFYLYVNAGGGRISHRMKVEDFRTAPGNEGLASPWPDITGISHNRW